MSDFMIPAAAAPSNLHLPEGVRATDMIEGDVFDIASRIKDVDPSLFILMLTADADNCAYAIMERCSDGVDRLVYKTPELDARVVKKCEYLRHVPLEVRIVALEKEIEARDKKTKEDEAEQLYEEFGGPMLRELWNCGFSQSPVSYAKRRRR